MGANEARAQLQLQLVECWHDAVRQLLARVLSQGISCCCTEDPLRIDIREAAASSMQCRRLGRLFCL